jgi:import inner membrane translocase subunit TIM10
MSMFGGFGRPQPSSAEKIAAAEAEMDLVTDMFNKYFPLLPSHPFLSRTKANLRPIDFNKLA